MQQNLISFNLIIYYLFNVNCTDFIKIDLHSVVFDI